MHSLYRFISLTDEQKKVFTYGFSPLMLDYKHQLQKFMESYGQHPTDDNLLAKGIFSYYLLNI